MTDYQTWMEEVHNKHHGNFRAVVKKYNDVEVEYRVHTHIEHTDEGAYVNHYIVGVPILSSEDENKIIESLGLVKTLVPFPEPVVKFPLSDTFYEIYEYPSQYNAEIGLSFMYMFESEALEEIAKQINTLEVLFAEIVDAKSKRNENNESES